MNRCSNILFWTASIVLSVIRCRYSVRIKSITAAAPCLLRSNTHLFRSVLPSRPVDNIAYTSERLEATRKAIFCIFRCLVHI
jgi:hypothetical protein